jgi:hypothetical protein
MIYTLNNATNNQIGRNKSTLLQLTMLQPLVGLYI